MASTVKLGEENFDVIDTRTNTCIATFDSEAKAKRRATRDNKLYLAKGIAPFVVRPEAK